jgi:hydrogenase maturation protease
MRPDVTICPPTMTLILGIGNSLLADDGVGLHVLRALTAEAEADPSLRLCDGGTVGLALLPEIENCARLIVIDAVEMGAPSGTLRVFVDAAMDAQMHGSKRSAHEVALADLMGAAHLLGTAPSRRALVGVQPGSTGWGLEPTPPVAAAIEPACVAVRALIKGWSDAA